MCVARRTEMVAALVWGCVCVCVRPRWCRIDNDMKLLIDGLSPGQGCVAEAPWKGGGAVGLPPQAHTILTCVTTRTTYNMYYQTCATYVQVLLYLLDARFVLSFFVEVKPFDLEFDVLWDRT